MKIVYWLRVFIAHLLHPLDCCLVEHAEEAEEIAAEPWRIDLEAGVEFSPMVVADFSTWEEEIAKQ